jgi:DNA repair exonuclease SbcCD ATPase subunit
MDESLAGGGSVAAGSSTSVRVAVRIRPLIGQELTERCAECIYVSEENKHQVVLGKTCFTFDYVFGKRAGQQEIYNDCVGQLVLAAFEGFNATVLAYGQTGSGKTYTMGSASNLRVSDAEIGIIPRVIQDIFETIRQRKEQDPACHYTVSAQFLEIYGEEIKDLLDPVNSRVMIRENQNSQITVVGAREEMVSSEEEMMMVLERGSVCRTTGSTLMNAQSSRSHAIFTMLLENRIARSTGAEGEGGGAAEQQFEIRRSKFHFVDLAGSERAKRTGAEGKRLREGIDINKGLLVLGNVISALGDSKKRGRVHVPYRDSKLTRMLQDSLGGNSQTVMIACVSPSETNMHETLNALRYANRARNIQNKPIVNRDRDSALIVELKRQVQALAMELLRLRSGESPSCPPGDFSQTTMPDVSKEFLETLAAQTSQPGAVVALDNRAEPYDVLKQRNQDAEAEMRRLTDENKKLRAQSSDVDEQLLQVTAEKEYYRMRLKEATGEDLELELDRSQDLVPEELADADGGGGGGGGGQGDGQPEPQAQAQAALPVGAGRVEEKAAFLGAVKGYLSEIGRLKEANADLTRTKCNLEIRMHQLESRALYRASGSASVSRRESRLTDTSLQEVQEVIEEARAAEAWGELDPAATGALDAPGVDDSQGGGEEVKVELSPEEEGQYFRRQQEMSISVADLSRDIAMKEKLVQQLRESVKRYEVMKRFYEEKLRQMDEETTRFEGERQKLLKDLEELERKNEDEQKGLHQSLLKKLQDKEAQLQSARRKQEELSQLSKIKAKTDAQVKQLSDEISGMKRQKNELLRRIEGEKKRFQLALREKTQEIDVMKKAARRDAQEIQRLMSTVEKTDTALRRTTEELSQLRVNTRKLGPRDRQRSSSSDTDQKYSEMERKTKRWLDSRIREVARKEEATERLAAEYQRRMALLKTKEDLESARNRIHGRRRSVREMILNPFPPGERGAASGLVEKGGGDRLTPEEEATLEELEERIEACQAQLEFKDDRIRKIESIITSRPGFGGGETAIMQIENSCNTLEQSHTVIRVLFDMLVASRRQSRLRSDQVSEIEEEKSRLTMLLEESDMRLKAEKRLFEQQLMRVNTDYEAKISGLIDHSQVSGLFGDISPLAQTSEQVLSDEATRSIETSTGDGSLSRELSTSQAGDNPALEQYKCMMRLSSERNQALREQVQHVQAARDDLEQRVHDLELRQRRARDELMEKDDQIKVRTQGL